MLNHVFVGSTKVEVAVNMQKRLIVVTINGNTKVDLHFSYEEARGIATSLVAAQDISISTKADTSWSGIITEEEFGVQVPKVIEECGIRAHLKVTFGRKRAIVNMKLLESDWVRFRKGTKDEVTLVPLKQLGKVVLQILKNLKLLEAIELKRQQDRKEVIRIVS